MVNNHGDRKMILQVGQDLFWKFYTPAGWGIKSPTPINMNVHAYRAFTKNSRGMVNIRSFFSVSKSSNSGSLPTKLP